MNGCLLSLLDTDKFMDFPDNNSSLSSSLSASFISSFDLVDDPIPSSILNKEDLDPFSVVEVEVDQEPGGGTCDDIRESVGRDGGCVKDEKLPFWAIDSTLLAV